MQKIQITNLSKKYTTKSGEFYALKDVSLSFPNSGLVSICGPSGSGKSTLINIIAKLDKPSTGEILFDGIEISNKRNVEKFYKNKVGIVFQQYNLIDDIDVISNVMLPSLIAGHKKKAAYKKAKELLEFVGIQENKHSLICSKLSGGERQRVSIARSLINKPEILLCDEPTGALDSYNSEVVMKLLKKISENKLVIMVSHNLQIVDKYSDRIITLSQGEVISDYIKYEEQIPQNNKHIETGKHSTWISLLAKRNFKKRIKRNIFSILSFVVSSISMLLTIGFINGKDNSINNACYRQLDYGIGTISKEVKLNSSGLVSLTKSIRPELDAIIGNDDINKNFDIYPNFDAILPANIDLFYDERLIENTNYLPLKSFNSDAIDKRLLLKGNVPENDTLNEVVINSFCYQHLKKILAKDPLNEVINTKHLFTSTFVDYDGTEIIDIFDYSISFKIVGVAKELNYLSTNKIYYSFIAFKEFLSSYLVENLTTYNNYDITWYDRVEKVDNSSPLSSYSYRLFPKYKKIDISSLDFKGLSFSSSSLIIKDSLAGFMDVAEYGVILFLIITIIGLCLILGIMSFASYSEDHKISAILSCLGAKRSEITNIYLFENILSALIGLTISLPLSFLLQTIINNIIFGYIDVTNIIAIPFSSFLGIKLLLPISFLLITFLICLFVTVIPISFSKRNELKKELQSL